MSNYKNSKDQEFIRNISHYNDRERRSVNKRKSKPKAGSSLITDELTPLIKEFTIEYVENQKRLLKAEQRKSNAEIRKTESIETFFSIIKNYMEGFNPKNSIRDSVNRRGPYKQRPLDDNRKKIFKIIAKMREKNSTYEDIANQLIKEKIPTLSGRGTWHAQTVHRLCRDRLYKIFLST